MFNPMTIESTRAHRDRYEERAQHARFVNRVARRNRRLMVSIPMSVVTVITTIFMWQGVVA